MSAITYGATPILVDVVDERLAYAQKTLGVRHVVNSMTADAKKSVDEITNGRGAELVMECSGANSAIRSTLELVSNAGRITLIGWPKVETPLPTDVITKKEVDILGARTSAGEFDETIDLIYNNKVEIRKILTKTVSLQKVPETVIDIEKNPGQYMKVVVAME